MPIAGCGLLKYACDFNATSPIPHSPVAGRALSSRNASFGRMRVGEGVVVGLEGDGRAGVDASRTRDGEGRGGTQMVRGGGLALRG